MLSFIDCSSARTADSLLLRNYCDPAHEELEIEHGGNGADVLYRGTEKMGEMDFRCDGSICF